MEAIQRLARVAASATAAASTTSIEAQGASACRSAAAASCIPPDGAPRRASPHAGLWRLAAGAALSLSARQPAQLVLAHGVLWVTWSAPRPSGQHPAAARDHWLHPGDVLTLPARRRVVLQAMHHGEPARFDCRPLTMAGAAPSPAVVSPPLVQWRTEVAAPWHEALAALGAAGRAGGRLVGGLASFAIYLIAKCVGRTGAKARFDI